MISGNSAGAYQAGQDSSVLGAEDVQRLSLMKENIFQICRLSF